MNTNEISVEELAKERGAVVLDVREAYELENSRIDPHIHIPLGDLPERLAELDPARSYVVVCRSGSRSGTATKFLLAQGFKDVRNLVGGMNEWVEKIDPSMKKY